MNYESMQDRVYKLDFVESRESASAMIKAVLGTLASRMKKPQAHRFTDDLPEPLNYETLRGHQAHVTNISVDQFISGLCSQFRINEEQAKKLVTTVLHCAKDSQPQEEILTWEQGLPAEWIPIIEKA
ncbi:hypothetical protein CHISP_2516 [Chitinispirillum alkaliphilum]|nr:hypothetical protein CHISP_2516 [Chitinispirillum alkaliphilum]